MWSAISAPVKFSVKLAAVSGGIVAFHPFHSLTRRSYMSRLAVLQVGALHRIVDHIEQERVVEDLEVLPVADRAPLAAHSPCNARTASAATAPPCGADAGSRFMPSGG